MASPNQIKNIGDRIRELVFEQCVLFKQLRKVEAKIKECDLRSKELWASRFQHPPQENDSIFMEDEYDEECPLRKRNTKKRHKGTLANNSDKTSYRYFNPLGKKKRAKESRACKKTCRSRSHNHNERDHGELKITEAA